MVINSSEYGGKCVCGSEHVISTQMCVIEPGSIRHIDEYMERCGIEGRRCAVYGTNSYGAVRTRPRVEQEVVLDSRGLHATEVSTAELSRRMPPDTRVLIAVGSGSIHDITRFCAARHGLKFVSVPTAASVDGFCSTVAAMTWEGYKKTVSAVAPELVVADTDIIRAAPAYLTASCVGDMLGKYIALSDWRIAHAVTGEHFCPVIYDIMRKAADTVMQNCRATLAGDEDAFEAVVYGLLMSGLAMQMMGNSRPASGAEHHISHLIETRPAGLSVDGDALHGEKVGVGTVLCAREYKRLAEIEDIEPHLAPYAPIDRVWMRKFFGERLFAACDAENKDDCLAAVTPRAIADRWGEVRNIICEIPDPEEIYGALAALGGKKRLSDIGVDEALLPTLLDASPVIRNRLTLMRMRRMMKNI